MDLWLAVVGFSLALVALLVAAAFWSELKWLILGGWRDLSRKNPLDFHDRRRIDLRRLPL